jgi:uncharacterized protein (TIGR00297 family)
MEIIPLDLFWGLGLSSLVAYGAYRKGSLSPSGLFAATVLGTLIFVLGKLLFWAIMILFFVSSSLLSKINHGNKALVQQEFAKTGRRDWLQVLANSAVGLSFAAAYWYSGNQLFIVGYVATFATVNADTWATEIGILSNRPPISILSFKPGAPGVSGAVSLLGTGAALAGALFISSLAGIGLLWSNAPSMNWLLIIAVGTLGGFAGCLTDSLLGATVQAMFKCRVCGKLTEKKEHHGQPTQLAQGLLLFQNDMVNLTSSLVGGLLAMAIFSIL